MRNTTKRIAFITLIGILLLFSASCRKQPDDITGDIRGDIGEIGESNENKADGDNGEEKVPEADNGAEQNSARDENPGFTDALGFIQSLGAAVYEGEGNACDETAERFVKAVREGDCDTISELCGSEASDFDYFKDVEIQKSYITPFYIPEQTAAEKQKEGYAPIGDYRHMYAVTLEVGTVAESERLSEMFPYKTSVWFLEIDEYSENGYPVSAFVKSETASERIFTPLEINPCEYFISEFSSSECFGRLTAGKNDPAGFDLTGSVHLVTHLMAQFTGELPPYSMNEVNGFIKNAFLANDGISTDDIELWSSAYESRLGIDYSDDSVYTDGDLKLLGCSYAHGGTTIEHSIRSVERGVHGAETYTVDYYSDFAGINVAKTVVYHFEALGEYPCLVGVELEYDSGREIASFSI